MKVHFNKALNEKQKQLKIQIQRLINDEDMADKYLKKIYRIKKQKEE